MAHVCPVRLYRERDLQIRESARYTITKQVSYHLGSVLDPDVLWAEVQAIEPETEPESREFLESCISSCNGKSWRTPVQYDVPVQSERLGIRGVVDKVFSEEPYFAITRSSDPPSAGAYGSDRLRVTCYVYCVRESLGLPAEGGIVEYISGGILRECHPQPRDRRTMLRALRTARRVLAGEIPKKPLNAPCDRCPHETECLTEPRKLSDLW